VEVFWIPRKSRAVKKLDRRSGLENNAILIAQMADDSTEVVTHSLPVWEAR
jgi:hypothetical protein